MTELRTRMIKQLELSRLSVNTHKAYLAAVEGLAGFYHRSPDELSPEQVKDYIHYLLTERRLRAFVNNLLEQ